ncbi:MULTISPECIES: S24 family peptidase [Chryseobacterium]|uniref:Transcriptional regulator n=1 Tax=Candidatus Chryseobacterium massiliense TaxID=204089 RepID=A0A3D9B2M3_9FLAO|nr:MULTISPECIES: S24/S26 family peptidase [Chryseobacterium]REC47843.1 transcriptional regulator [Candidatus Chryseobacterium massiliae]
MKTVNDITIRFLDVYNYLLSSKKVNSSREFAEKIDISTSMMTEIIKGRTNAGINPIQKTVQEFSEIDGEWLLIGTGQMLKSKNKENLTLSDGKENGKVKGKEPKVKENLTNNIPSVITVDSLNRDNIVLVPQSLKAGYLEGYNDVSFISKLPSYRMPGLNNGIFRMFEIEGNSMYPTLPNKSFVVGQFVENWTKDIKNNQIYAIISNELEDGIVKRCINKIEKYNNLICKSDNKRQFPTQNINPSSIKEIWEIKLHLNFNLPDPADMYDQVIDLQGEVQSLKTVLKRANLLK